MLRIQQLSKSYGNRTLFDQVTVALTPGERLGLVGRNGTGKTTLLKLILGEEAPDSGKIETPKHYKIGHVSQHIAFEAGTVLEEACLGLPIQEGDWVEQHKAEEALMGLGFSVADFDRPPSEFSGGFQVRLQLAKVLVSAPNLLLLDEPTNYLDIVSMRWLQKYLRNWDGEIILITHDRDFMNRVTTHSMVIHRGNVRRVEGSTDKLYEMLELEEEIHEKTRANQAKSRKDTERFVERFRYTASKARQVQSRIKMLEKQGQLDELEAISNLSFKFNAAPFHAHTMLHAEQLEFGYGDGESLLEDLSFSIEPGDRVAIIGKNGKGKSTLLNLIGGELTPRQGGFKRHNAVELAHFGQTNIDRLHRGLTVEEEILSVIPDGNRGHARGICGLMMFSGDDALKRVDVLSGGERARVLLGKLLVSPANFVLLDEPTNHLDMESIESLTSALLQFSGSSIIVTHNERVLHALATKLVVFDRGRASWFDGTYREFLDRVGWSDEDDAKGRGGGKRANGTGKNGKQHGKSTPKANDKDLRKQRAKIHDARSKAMKPLERKVHKFEDAIMELEPKLKESSEAMERAVQAGDQDGILKHSTDAAHAQREIEDLFEKLEAATKTHDEKAAEFDAQLEQLG